MHRTARNSVGITLIELVIALAIGALLSIASSSLLLKPVQLVEDVHESGMMRSLEGIRGSEFVHRFSRTHLMRRGFFNCSDSNLETVLQGTDEFTDRDVTVTPPFTIVYSEYATIVGLVSTTPARIAIANPVSPVSLFSIDSPAGSPFSGEFKHFAAGALVLLSPMNDPSVGRLFQITRIDEGTGEITLDDGSVEIPEELKDGENDRCSYVTSAGIGSLSALVNSPQNTVFGRSSNTLRADIVRFAHYFTEQSTENATLRDLREIRWPVPRMGNVELDDEDGNLIVEEVALPAFGSLAFRDASWERSGGMSDANGRFRATLVVGRQKRALSSETPADSRVTVPGIWQVRYSTATGGQMNFGAMVPSASADPSFPTCGLTLAPLRDFVKRDDNMFAQFYALSGEIIDAGVPSGIAVEMTAPGAAEPLCWNEGQLVPTDTLFNVPVAAASRDRVSLNPTASGALERVICEVPNGSSFSGFLSYFDANSSRMMTIPCGTAGVPPGTFPGFAYVGPATECFDSGVINFGTLTVAGTAEPGPSLFALECEWSVGGFGGCDPNPTKGNLLKVRLGPLGLPGGIPGATGANSNEITCSS